MSTNARAILRSVQRVAMVGLLVGLMSVSSVGAEERVTEGGTARGQWLLGFRAGFAPLTQNLHAGFSADVGSLVNVHALYGLNRWVMVGLMVEWERHAVDRDRPVADLGHQDTVSLLPTVEVRPVRIGPIVPYASMGIGVNVNSFGEATARQPGEIHPISPSNTFAWRLGWGADWFFTRAVALNLEMAYKRNDGHATIGAARSNDWNASSFAFLVGLRAAF